MITNRKLCISSLVGVIKGIITTIIGFFTFGGVAVNVYTLFGIILNSSGGILYFYTKYSDQVRQKLQEEYMADHVINVEETTANGDVNKNSKTESNTVIDVEGNYEDQRWWWSLRIENKHDLNVHVHFDKNLWASSPLLTQVLKRTRRFKDKRVYKV